MADASSKIEAIIEHMTFTKGVIGVVVCNSAGVPIRDSFQEVDRSRAIAYAELAAELARSAEAVCMVSNTTLDCLRIRTMLTEVIIKSNGEYLLVVLQEPSE
jgi:predicted regulator of Ras-like GTPase activity (Roadblock/LC7/MglB family)